MCRKMIPSTQRCAGIFKESWSPFQSVRAGIQLSRATNKCISWTRRYLVINSSASGKKELGKKQGKKRNKGNEANENRKSEENT